MPLDDEDDMPSSTERLLHADARTDKMERKAAAKGKLLNQVKLASLKQQVGVSATAPDQRDDGQKAAEANAAAPLNGGDGDFGTKTLEQQSQEQVQTAQDKPTADKMIEDAKRQEDAQTQAQEEYQQDMG